jgi:uncharacterized protein YegJ (DUF2314 family)
MIILKRSFGFIAVLLAASMVAVIFIHPFIGENSVFHWQFLLGLPLYWLIYSHGMKWMMNYYDLNEIRTDKDNKNIVRSITLARESIHVLCDALIRKSNDCHVKFGLPTKSNNIEHIWCVAHNIENNLIWCSIANNPIDLADEFTKQRFSRSINEIEDYLIPRDSEILGGFSIMACAQTLLDMGYNLDRQQKKMLKSYSAYLIWGFH